MLSVASLSWSPRCCQVEQMIRLGNVAPFWSQRYRACEAAPVLGWVLVSLLGV